MPQQEQPAHVTITEALRVRINVGEWAPGSRLPSRAALAKDYGVGDFVVQRAQEALIRDGVLEGRSGSGTYIPEDRPRRQLWLDADSRFGVRPDAAGHWAPVCRLQPAALGYFAEARPLLLARPGDGGGDGPAYRVRAALVSPDDAQVLGLLRGDAVTLIEHGGSGPESGVVMVPGRYWDLLLP
ncbi:GntR family transcriptional regulator [Kitasatospora griseola]|uniref:GntR family transcriptional regulator n=1 Tax=Kitasatospora griseola TaxID=2064 RepID=UPI00343BA87F